MNSIEDQILQKKRELATLKGLSTAPQKSEIVVVLDDRNPAEVSKAANKVEYPVIAIKWEGEKPLTYYSQMGYWITISPKETIKVPAADVVVLSKYYADGKGHLKFLTAQDYSKAIKPTTTKEAKLAITPEAITESLVRLPANLPPEVIEVFKPYLSEEARAKLEAKKVVGAGDKVAIL